MTPDNIENDVLTFADRLVAAFGSHDVESYFSAFSEDASFLFHNVKRLIVSREEYRAEWRLWEERDGFRVLSCQSSDRRINVLGDVAVFTHRVATTARFGTEAVHSRERETIVFKRFPDGRWLGVHEHLSIDEG